VSGAIGTGTDIVVWGMINCEFASFGRFTALAAKPWFRGWSMRDRRAAQIAFSIATVALWTTLSSRAVTHRA